MTELEKNLGFMYKMGRISEHNAWVEAVDEFIFNLSKGHNPHDTKIRVEVLETLLDYMQVDKPDDKDILDRITMLEEETKLAYKHGWQSAMSAMFGIAHKECS